MLEPAGALAAAIVDTAVELYPVRPERPHHEQLLANRRVRAAFPASLLMDAPAQLLLLKRLAIHLAREVLDVWTTVSPDDRAPEDAIAAAEAWAACPCAEHAEAAAAIQPAAIQSLGIAWHRPPKAAAWAARTAAWVADAPKHDWQAVSAIRGACGATSVEHVVDVATAWLALQ